MGWLGLLVVTFAASFATPSYAAGQFGICQTDTSIPNLPRTICQLPPCPTGLDCVGPIIDKASATIQFNEPVINWKETCPDKAINGPCWEVYLDFKFKMIATDPAGVSHIGINLLSDINNRRAFKRHWGMAQTKDSEGKYQIAGASILHVPPAMKMELAVYEVCARDSNNNESCSLPLKSPELKLTF